MLNKVIKLIVGFFKNPSKNREDIVLHILLIGFFIVSAIAVLVAIYNKISLKDDYNGGPIPVMIVANLVILSLIRFFCMGYLRAIRVIFTAFLLVIIVNIIVSSGFENPFALLLMVFYIIVCSILFERKRLILSISIMFAVFLSLAALETKHITNPDLSWRLVKQFPFQDAVSIAVILLVIVMVSWLFNREISNYIAKLQESQKLLQNERDLLETKVQERTAQLQAEQFDRMTQMSKFAEFGRLAQGLFHDLANPLTALTLNLDQLKKEKDTNKIKNYLRETSVATENMKKLIDSSLNYSRNKIEKSSFSIVDELENVRLLCNYKARKIGASLIFQERGDVKLIGNKTRFSQMISNLVINALEAFERQNNFLGKDREKYVQINFSTEDKHVVLTIADNASGMSEKTRRSIFKPFFSTKEISSHSGIGLSMCKDIVESDFMGKIEVRSELNQGTEFIITIQSVLDE